MKGWSWLEIPCAQSGGSIYVHNEATLDLKIIFGLSIVVLKKTHDPSSVTYGLFSAAVCDDLEYTH